MTTLVSALLLVLLINLSLSSISEAIMESGTSTKAGSSILESGMLYNFQIMYRGSKCALQQSVKKGGHTNIFSKEHAMKFDCKVGATADKLLVTYKGGSTWTFYSQTGDCQVQYAHTANDGGRYLNSHEHWLKCDSETSNPPDVFTIHYSSDRNVQYWRINNGGSLQFSAAEGTGGNDGFEKGEHAAKIDTTDRTGSQLLIEFADNLRILSLDFNMDRKSISNGRPMVLGQITYDNRAGTIAQTLQQSQTESSTTTKSQTNSMNVGLKVGMSYKASVPLVAETTASVELSVSYTHTWGTTSTKSKSKQIVASCVVPPGKKYRCKMIGQTKIANIPYTMRVQSKKSLNIASRSGTWNGVMTFDLHGSTEVLTS